MATGIDMQDVSFADHLSSDPADLKYGASLFIIYSGSKRLGSRGIPPCKRAIRRPPAIDGRNPTPLHPRLYMRTGFLGSTPTTRILPFV